MDKIVRYTTRVLYGAPIAERVEQSVCRAVSQFRETHNIRPPSLAIVQVGHRPDSSVFIGAKLRACDRAGIDAHLTEMPERTDIHYLCGELEQLNANPDVDGILLQLPLPVHLQRHTRAALATIAQEKDVDGFHPLNWSQFVTGGVHSGSDHERSLLPPLEHAPCAAAGVLELLDHYQISAKGRNVTVVGCSQTVGMPIALSMLNAGATLAVCHAETPRSELIAQTRRADLLISAVGVPGLITGDMVKPGAVLIDVGLTVVPGGEGISYGYGIELLGDIDFASCAQRAYAITPTPGGLGPCTVSALLRNIYSAYRQQHEPRAAQVGVEGDGRTNFV